MKICFLTKIEKPGAEEAIVWTNKITQTIDVFHGVSSEPFPTKAGNGDYDLLISYLSPWIVPETALKNTKRWNINFHPGPPEYPGIGCFNFAIYDLAKHFGATAHIMEPMVDTGDIIGTRRFSMTEKETVESLSQKTYSALLSLYKDIISYVESNDSLPHCDEVWKRKPYKRRELEDLATIKPDMSKQEIDARIRATYYPGKPAPFVEIAGYRFEYNHER